MPSLWQNVTIHAILLDQNIMEDAKHMSLNYLKKPLISNWES